MEYNISSFKPFTAIALILLLMPGCLVAGLSEREITSLAGDVDLQGHRGARGNRPENTLPAFIYCIEHGMTTIELDTVLTKDKHLIVCHDPVINSSLCIDDNGNPAKEVPISELTVEEIKKLDCGAIRNDKFPEQVPVKNTRMVTLTEFFNFVKAYEKTAPGIRPPKFNIETKFPKVRSREDILEVAGIMVKTIEDAGMVERTTVQSFVIEILPEVKKLNKNLKISALFQPTKSQGLKMILGFSANRSEILERTVAAGADILSPYFLYVNPEFVKECHRHGIKVVPWTVNDAKKIEELLNYGVDGIISDYPDLLLKVYKKWRAGKK